jgi:hypothetical protein
MKNKMTKIAMITLTMTGLLWQIGCSPYGYGDDYNSGGYANYEKETLDPSTLSTNKKDETASKGRCDDKRTSFLNFSDADLYQAAIDTKVGNCVLSDAANCPSCACAAYVKVTTSLWSGQGWALNPDSLDSTGCVSQTQYPGYTPAMAGPDLALDAVEQIRDALRNPEDICGLCDSKREITTDMALE